ncbi:MAG: M20/M25/M40 family metallo-hydrolase [Clostridiales bacterium]|nr:M20/M25/M40 family metallo-hydrolase [Clostridiales bacterium]
MAHTDTVFPDTTPFEPVVKDGRIHCPAVGDDTTNLAQMLFAIRYLIKTGKRPKGNVLFVANSCEEGLGNLKGSRKVMEDFGHRVAEFTTFDGSYTTYVDHSVGSRRYEVTITTEGGHSYGAFGNRNAIHYMASLIDTLYTLKVPKEGKSTYNVGIIEGGTSVNTIAQQCKMLFEYRSDRRENLASMDAFFHKTIEAYRAMGIGVTVELVGDRPCMGDVDPAMEQKLRDRVIKAIKDHTGNVVTGTSGSTDCNIPHSMGVPAICFGGYLGAGAHTREEYIEMESLKTGMPIILQYVLDDFN